MLLGGARSGKSDQAVRLGTAWPGPVVFVATAEGRDDDMATRIERHRLERPDSWATFESPRFNQFEANSIEPAALMIVDCLTLLVSNLLLGDDDWPALDEAALLAQVDSLAAALAARPGPTLLISNEVGMGVHPPTELGRSYRDILGRANRIAVDQSETAAIIVAGRLMALDDHEAVWR